MIRTLLVANRGEIARRVFRTADQMGIRTVAVYSDPDASSPHVADADSAVPLGGSSSADTYLNAAKILDAARRSAADAIHPGYGFLSENADFAEACDRAGLIFVGPSSMSIRDMGLKDRAKEIARQAGVPVLADAQIVGNDSEEWQASAATVGYPLLVKAIAGGGGKGMRLVEEPAELEEAILGARREASNSFGNPKVFIEKYLRTSRHIEIQVFGDAHGGAVHLGERECSIQRRHQKVLEEAPSPAVGVELRAEMGATSVALVRQLGYLGAGTVEYLLDDATNEFYFLEMNTRLQVEHPVTEEVYGLDLVRMQLEIAVGLPLGVNQADVLPNGHAIEVRLYAEDPAQGFMPAPGPLLGYLHPDNQPGLRFEDGVAAPGEISAFYDPMVAKVISHAPRRDEAASKLAAALDSTEVHGTTTNKEFLSALLRDADFLAGNISTDFLDRHAELCNPSAMTPPTAHLAAAVAVLACRRRAVDKVTGHAPPGFRVLPSYPLTSANWSQRSGQPIKLGYRLRQASGNTDLILATAGTQQVIALRDLSTGGARVQYDGVEYPCKVTMYSDGSVWVNDSVCQSSWYPEERLPEHEIDAVAAGPVASLPGAVVAVLVQEGDSVHTGQRLVVLEAMKMEHAAIASADGVVARVHVKVGEYVEAHQVLVTIETAEVP
jgi:3-methylcrotonyl-CoA carboxylase alpha subunit